MVGVGCCDQDNDSPTGTLVKAYQTTQCAHLLPWPYSYIFRYAHLCYCFCAVLRLTYVISDIHLTRALRGKPTDPKYYKRIFERGIDPDVENPEQCHAHSEIPDEWPPLDEILDYSERVRNRARAILEEGSANQDRSLAEALWIGFEHEAMHLETFLYMLIQSEKTLPPIGVDIPDFAKLAGHAKENEVQNKWFRIPQQTFTIGLDDSNDDALPKDSFGWDNEKPQRSVSVHAFEAQARPVTNGEYAKYLEANRRHEIPASWTIIHSDQDSRISNGVTGSNSSSTHIAVRTVFGPVPFDLAQDWPVIASYDELASYAQWAGCRIPTYEEVRSIYLHADKQQGMDTLTAANGHRYALMNPDDEAKREKLIRNSVTALMAPLMGPMALLTESNTWQMGQRRHHLHRLCQYSVH